MLRDTPPISDGSLRGTFGGSGKTLPPDVTKKQSHQAQTLSQNSDIVEQVKAEEAEKTSPPDMVCKAIKAEEARA